MTYMRCNTQTGEAYIVMTEVVAMVRRPSNKSMKRTAYKNFNIDIHMRSGTIFVVLDYNELNFNAMVNMWEMFNRDNWKGSPGRIHDGKMVEI
jgi:hypothetical protein